MLTMSAKVGRSDVNAVPMTKARPKLTEIVDAARDKDISTALTEYGRPRAFVVSVPFFQSAVRLNELARILEEQRPELYAELTHALATIEVPAKMTES